MNDEHNEQLLWFIRRTTEVEERLRKMTEQFNERAREAMQERDLADALAEQLREIARMLPEYELVVTNYNQHVNDGPATYTRTGGRRLPRNTRIDVDPGTVKYPGDDDAIVLLYPEQSIGYAKSPLEKWREARWKRFGRPLEPIAAEPEPWP